MRSAKVLLLLVTLLLALGALGAKRGRHPARNRNRQNKRSCPIPGCTRCNNQTSCAVCRPGYALTDDEKCGSCGAHCSACARAGPGNCDSCTRGFTLHRPHEGEHGWCEKCAAHCNTCDRAGPGKCDQCGNRRMLDVRMELHDEVHECIPCGDGCRKCSSEAGCTKCDWFYVLHSNGTCTFGWGRIVVGILVVILFCYGCCMLLPPDDFDAPERPMGGPPRRRAPLPAARRSPALALATL